MQLKRSTRRFSVRRFLPLAVLPALLAMVIWMAPPTSANHPVYVEGNCDSPVPGTTLVSPGTCGDFDGDGRIGTAEDTDGADRIFGTLRAALGPGAGAAAGTGANMNGRVIIVASGRYSEAVDPGTNSMLTIQTGAHLQIEAAPGVEANIDAVLQGDPAGLNNVRQLAIGAHVDIAAGGTVVFRNLTIRNFMIGLRQRGAGRLLLENCRFDNNRDYGLQILDNAHLVMDRSQVNGTGRRVGSADNTPTPGTGIQFAGNSFGWLLKSVIINSVAAGVQQSSTDNVLAWETLIFDNDGGNNTGKPLIKGAP